MSRIVTLNGIPYIIPETGEVGWGNEVTNYLVALGSGGVLSLEGGNFTLQSELNFGPNFGVASPYFRSGLNPAATAGVLRLTNTESVMWRNAANTANLALSVVGDTLFFAGVPIGGSGGGSPLTTKGDLYTFSNVNTRQPVGPNGTVLVADSSTSTGLQWVSLPGISGNVTGFTFVDANGISGIVATPTSTPTLTLSLGAITPTSVTASGPITGSNFSGTSVGTNTGDQTITLTGDVIGSGTGTFATTYNGIVPINKGGTGQTTTTGLLNSILPPQAGNAGKVLTTDGTNTSWLVATGSGTVTQVALNATNGLSGTVSNPTTVPTINIGMTPTGVIAGSYTNTNITVDANGRITSATNGSGGGGGSGTVTSVSVVSANGVSGSVATPTTTPAITLNLDNITPLSVSSSGPVTGSNISGSSSGTNTGDQTITLTGDVTGSGTGTFATILANTTVVPGSYNNVTVDSKGRVITGTNQPYLTGNQTITISGDATGSGATSIALTLANTTVTPGSYVFTTLTVDSKGRLTAASSGSPVTTVSASGTQGVTVNVTNPTTTPNIAIGLGNITPTSVKTTIIGGFSEPFSTTLAIDANLLNVSKFTLVGNATVPKPTNIPNGVAYTAAYFITQNAASTVTWFTTIRWKNGVPVMSTIVGATDIYTLTTFDGGTIWYATAIQGIV